MDRGLDGPAGAPFVARAERLFLLQLASESPLGLAQGRATVQGMTAKEKLRQRVETLSEQEAGETLRRTRHAR